MRALHRIISLFVVIVTLYLGVTGTLIQLIDLQTLFRHARATDPEMMAIREDKDGPDDYAVLETAEYTARPLPATVDLQSGLSQLIGVARTTWGNAPLDYAEVRMAGSNVVGRLQSGKQLLVYEFATGKTQLERELRRGNGPHSTRNEIKGLHRMTSLGNWALWINPIVGVAMGVFVVTGVVMYWRLLAARRRIRRGQWFWSAGGWWRTLHRWVSIVASAFILLIALSGTWLAVESLVFGYYLVQHLPAPGQPMVRESGVTPLQETRLSPMLSTTLAAYKAAFADQPLKVVRLRVYGGMPQGVVIIGLGDDTQQVVFNAGTGRRVSLTEPGYPPTGFPFGWQAHQTAKQIHRGSYIGLSGRWMDLLGGLAIIYLSVSGAVMYVDMWNRRRRGGRPALLWT